MLSYKEKWVMAISRETYWTVAISIRTTTVFLPSLVVWGEYTNHVLNVAFKIKKRSKTFSSAAQFMSPCLHE